MEEFGVLQLHRNKHFIKDCCAVINSEWPRSETARLHSLEASCDTLPTSLVLVKKLENNGNKAVIGHSKITPIPSMLGSCFVESVVIDHRYRGKGLGKFLMYKTEEYIKTLGINTVYLSTKDKEDFYSKLGYVRCPPVSIYGSFSSVQKLPVIISPSKKIYMKKKL
ncbi:N-alpha-acetyltransferase 80 [Adelges cooleyi]|uniref:N-alpha-acetyltransferase 80 n=1 Tax=Adelges cooleyi TaxID=133065 RepID=UPI0021802BBF|nr:N-alpha-acetyltransferase 80 [Adelges cooleyi]XP_050425427.1 N-alpha-acetyltransferase 80 [Adelges cooleyi]